MDMNMIILAIGTLRTISYCHFTPSRTGILTTATPLFLFSSQAAIKLCFYVTFSTALREIQSV